MRDDEPVAVALQVTELFEKLGVRYVIGGSLASMSREAERLDSAFDPACDD